MSLVDPSLLCNWIIFRDGRLQIQSGKVDIGQRISTALVQIVHEELTIPYSQIDVAPVRTGQSPDEGITSGSNSIEQSGHAIRCAAATLRCALIAVAARQTGTEPQDWHVEHGSLCLPATNHRIPIADLAAYLDPSTVVDPNVVFRVVDSENGPGPGMRGMAELVNGSFTFVHDLEMPGMQHARAIRPPNVNARLRSDETALEKWLEKDQRLIRDGSFLAITGPKEWPVVRAAGRLAAACNWDMCDGLPEIDVFSKLTAETAIRMPVVDSTPSNGSLPEPLLNPTAMARYERPYQLHGALGPSAALAEWNGVVLKIFCHSQGIYPLRDSIADSLGLDPSHVVITHVFGAGCYGHNGADDAAFEAALIAMQTPGVPILLKWTREDEHRWEPFAPAMAVELAAQIKVGKIGAYSAEVFSDTHRGRPRPGPDRAGPGKLLANRFRADPVGPPTAQPNLARHGGMHRNLDPIYDIPRKQFVKNLVTGLPHRTSAMRCLGAALNIFGLESFMDELALQSGIEPTAFRRAHLSDSRALAVLDELDLQVSRLPALTAQGGRGQAYAQYKNQMTRVGVSVDLAVDDHGRVRLLHAVIVADAGRVVDFEGLKAQLEGGFVQAASWALYEQVHWDRDGIVSKDWDSYPVIRFDNIPKIDVTVMNRGHEKSVGAGEASPGPTIAAIANAIFDATGLRMRRMPFTPDMILTRAIED